MAILYKYCYSTHCSLSMRTYYYCELSIVVQASFTLMYRVISWDPQISRFPPSKIWLIVVPVPCPVSQG